MSTHDSSSREALEIEFGLLQVDYDLQAELLDRVKSAATSLHYLRSKATILAEEVELEDDGSVSEVDKDIISLLTFTRTSKNQDSLVVTEDGAMLQSIQMIADVLESLLRRVTAAESEASFQKERVIIGEEEIRRKTIQIENMSLRLEEMKQIVHENKDVLDETVEIIKKLVEDSRKDREKAVENEEELRRVKTEFESLRNYVNTSTNVVEALLSSERQFQTIEARYKLCKAGWLLSLHSWKARKRRKR
ncbi:hypothetical protein BRARA_A00241 [Brassica rapa]|uniref:Uncharacterized protein n=1 Tax=Brassica campestris TaxID=3711 RepID=A0A398AHP1_BRACM|nr:hypothetical protein BRARA_A00241 [Brassica rapa]